MRNNNTRMYAKAFTGAALVALLVFTSMPVNAHHGADNDCTGGPGVAQYQDCGWYLLGYPPTGQLCSSEGGQNSMNVGAVCHLHVEWPSNSYRSHDVKFDRVGPMYGGVGPLGSPGAGWGFEYMCEDQYKNNIWVDWRSGTEGDTFTRPSSCKYVTVRPALVDNTFVVATLGWVQVVHPWTDM